ncbi:GNAT family N-acetyltransferase [Acidipila rosea]|uniref:Acetyltransferase (GNAT) family protein n=1 Tax=Acidipila rosea TaxID=768535 RepID=A0A4R1L7I0_9BACT|nr:GNAT family N-acetyltransferase [Acidipila rosea]TCK74154.1 acetyltransferase (GNAT) family protein [Acidipila rosea]
MSSALQLEILDLRHFPASSLRPVLEEESRLWSERLRWDYRSSADLLLHYLDSRVLPGYVAVEGGRVAGYVFCVYEDHKAIIGDVFALKPRQRDLTTTQVESQLLERLIELLQNTPGTTRIESQLLLHPHEAHADVFLKAGFELYKRLFLNLDLKISRAAAAPPLAAGFEMRTWRDEDFAPTGRLIADAYTGHLDSIINDQYRSVGGSLRFLHNIVRFPGCGYFDAASSRVIIDRNREEMAGVLLCSRVRDEVGHVTQLCVARSHRGLGLGSLMLQSTAHNLASRRFRGLTLTVTEANTLAVRLYQRLGFHEMHSFDAMMWEQ